MAFNIEVRKKQLESLNQYIKSSKENVESIFKSIGWTQNNVLETEDTKIKCPFDANHLLSFDTADQHLRKCKLKTEGYDLNEDFLSEPVEDASTSIKLDNRQKIEILNSARYSNHMFKPAWNGHEADPMTSNRFLSTFSVDERLCLYDYSVANTQKPPVPEEFTLSLSEAKKDGNESFEESLKKERDLKRRRAKYKSVHTNKKSHTEVIKEVIDNQMEQYTEWLKEKSKQNLEEEETHEQIKTEFMSNIDDSLLPNYHSETFDRPHSSISSRHSVHSSSSRGHSHRHNGDETYYEKSNTDKREYSHEMSFDKNDQPKETTHYEYDGGYYSTSFVKEKSYDNSDRYHREDYNRKKYDGAPKHDKGYYPDAKSFDYENGKSGKYKSSQTDRKKRSGDKYYSMSRKGR